MIRRYNVKRDRKAVHRIWRETGWLKKDKTDAMDVFLKGCRSWVGELEKQAECLVCTTPGTFRYMDEELPFSGVTSVATSRVGRKRDLASRVTAAAVADSVENGAVLSALGMFEQGFYNRLGFGTGSYEHMVRFDPAMLKVKTKPRVPVRLTAKDWASVHKGRVARRRGHGSCNLHPPEATRWTMMLPDHGFGLGYRDGPRGELTHHIWADARDNSEQGPYDIWWTCFRNGEQLLELMALVKALGDQVRLISIREPAGVQLQTLLAKPFYRSQISRKSDFESGVRAWAYWQLRICDLPACLEKTHLVGGPIRFNLELTDPIEKHLDENRRWRGIGGSYVVELGESSRAEKRADAALPVLKADTGAFSRLWAGVAPASGLAITDRLEAPQELIHDLDRLMRLPQPHPDWDF